MTNARTDAQESESSAFIGSSQSIEAVKAKLRQIAQSKSPLLVEGETGTGKEVVASFVHRLSKRNGPFIKVHLAALPPSLIESELFGQEKGAFTDAVSKPGRFQLADKGTLLLDEIGELSPEVQVKLLRVLEESEFERLGGTHTIKVDVRVIAATNRNLQREVGRGAFREDLFYRLAKTRVRLPPLREREDDVLRLAEYFAQCQKGTGLFRISDEDRVLLKSHVWRGNVRELQGVIEQSCLLSLGPELPIAQALAELQSFQGADGSGSGPLGRIPLDREQLIQCARESYGNISEISRKLRVTRERVKWALRAYRIDINRFRLGRFVHSYDDLSASNSLSTATPIPLQQDSSLASGDGSSVRHPQPPGAPYDPAWYVERREQEHAALAYLASPGTPVVLWGPQRFGKTTLSKHLLQVVRRQHPGCRVAELDLQGFSAETRGTLEGLLRGMAMRILEQLKHPMDWLDSAWSRPNDCKGRLSWLLEQQILREQEAPLILSIDNADCLMGCHFLADFFGLLRAWAEAGGSRGWAQLRILLVVSTTPSVLATDYHQSPFNLTSPIHLDDFSSTQAGELCRLYGLSWAETDLARLMTWVGGHPYLLRLAMYHAALKHASVDEIVRLEPGEGAGSTARWIFEDYLRDLRRRLSRRPELLQALSTLVHNQGARIERTLIYDLQRTGLVAQVGAAAYQLRGRIYEQLI